MPIFSKSMQEFMEKQLVSLISAYVLTFICKTIKTAKIMQTNKIVFLNIHRGMGESSNVFTSLFLKYHIHYNTNK